jgi:hypothetical protein
VGTEIVRARFARRLDDWLAALAIRRATGGGEGWTAQREAMLAELRDHAAALAGPDPTPTVESLATTAGLCWLALRWAEGQTWGEGLSIPQEEHALRRVHHAHRRYVSTLKALAAVRRLEAPRGGAVRVRLVAEALEAPDRRQLPRVESGPAPAATAIAR